MEKVAVNVRNYWRPEENIEVIYAAVNSAGSSKWFDSCHPLQLLSAAWTSSPFSPPQPVSRRRHLQHENLMQFTECLKLDMRQNNVSQIRWKTTQRNDSARSDIIINPPRSATNACSAPSPQPSPKVTNASGAFRRPLSSIMQGVARTPSYLVYWKAFIPSCPDAQPRQQPRHRLPEALLLGRPSSGPARGWRRGQVLAGLHSLHTSKTLIALVEDGVNALQKRVPKNVEVLVSTRLNATIDHSIASVGEGQVFLLDGEELRADGELDRGQLFGFSCGREDPTLPSRQFSVFEGRLVGMCEPTCT